MTEEKIWCRDLIVGTLVATRVKTPIQRFNYYYVHQVDVIDPQILKFYVLETTRDGVQLDSYEEKVDALFVNHGIKL